ncbi:sulfite exporter TauE/SafE family protein [Tsukamurella soli]|uniref:Probable membrane transporter protein n=1 Tax=Tsukamurella soli TaxID=644556 RepID=A0ABP8JMK9_9ACTN
MRGATEWPFLLVCGVVAGVIGTAGGITSLVAYPALLAVGIPPFAANVTNSVALLGSGFSSALRARPDIGGHTRTLRRWMPPTVLLSFVGAVLLTVTPGGVFDRIVPFLVAVGALTVLLQPWAARRRARTGAQPRRGLVAAGGAGVALYNGYFGAGAGVLMIALLLWTTEPVLHRANSLKNVILIASDLAPAVLFAVLGTVVWHAALPLGAGSLVGGLIGPAIARRIPASVLRVLIAACGAALAVWLAVRAYG